MPTAGSGLGETFFRAPQQGRSGKVKAKKQSRKSTYTNTHTHTHIYIYKTQKPPPPPKKKKKFRGSALKIFPDGKILKKKTKGKGVI